MNKFLLYYRPTKIVQAFSMRMMENKHGYWHERMWLAHTDTRLAILYNSAHFPYKERTQRICTHTTDEICFRCKVIDAQWNNTNCYAFRGQQERTFPLIQRSHQRLHNASLNTPERAAESRLLGRRKQPNNLANCSLIVIFYSYLLRLSCNWEMCTMAKKHMGHPYSANN